MILKAATQMIREMNESSTKTGQEILAYVKALHRRGWEKRPYEDDEAILQFPEWHLKTIALPKIGSTHPPIVAKYVSMTDDVPPIVVREDGLVLDGGHRVAAAEKRGEKIIRAWVPNPDKIDKNHLPLYKRLQQLL